MIKSDTYEFDFRKAFYEIKELRKDKLCIHKNFQKKIFFHDFDTIMKLFFTIVYITYQ